jgi:hypothetical protein
LEDSGTIEDLCEVVDERGLQAMARYEEVLDAVRRDAELAVAPIGGGLGKVERG